MRVSEDAIFVGYDHASIIGCLRPDVAYPDRRIRAGTRLVTEITRKPCPCPDDHVAVFVQPVTASVSHVVSVMSEPVAELVSDLLETLLAEERS
jgi:hypothetical protein